ncbi:uncharacterized protein METZ01_LOCUS108826, partial [marine metagenome]
VIVVAVSHEDNGDVAQLVRARAS